MTREFDDCEACVDAILERLGRRIVLGAPLGIGKPNALINAVYRRAKRDASISLDIVTALSLNPPIGRSELEERFLRPIRARVWPGYERLDYLDDQNCGGLPANIRVIEFYFRAASHLHHAQAQQDYVSSNYSCAAQALHARGVNLLVQAVAVREDAGGARRLSLSGNPDVTLPLLRDLASGPKDWLAVAMLDRGLPWLGNDAEIDAARFDFVLDRGTPAVPPFAVPHEPVTTTDWAIGLRASALVRDGGTLQVGIGALGDAACHALRLRERDNAVYRTALDRLGRSGPAAGIGGDAPFAQGLHIASELVSNPLFTLFEDGIARRRVFDDAALQRAIDAGQPPPAHGGIAVRGAFFIGPADFYRRLHALPEAQRALIGMTGVDAVNTVYRDWPLACAQRRDARLINITMKVTLLGAAASDQLGDGQVVSGVGGQHDFVAMAQQLPGARSILLLKATRGSGAALESNLVWEFPHATIARHERDLVVTEYGVADLRGRTDRECIEALLAIADSRLQERLAAEAIRAGKLPRDYRVPDACRDNLPGRLQAALAPLQAAGALPRLPFGCDLLEAELTLAGRLAALKAATTGWRGRLQLVAALARPADARRPEVAAALEHLALAAPQSLRERLLARLVRAALR